VRFDQPLISVELIRELPLSQRTKVAQFIQNSVCLLVRLLCRFLDALGTLVEFIQHSFLGRPVQAEQKSNHGNIRQTLRTFDRLFRLLKCEPLFEVRQIELESDRIAFSGGVLRTREGPTNLQAGNAIEGQFQTIAQDGEERLRIWAAHRQFDVRELRRGMQQSQMPPPAFSPVVLEQGSVFPVRVRRVIGANGR
jgi:hypothetical protein